MHSYLNTGHPPYLKLLKFCYIMLLCCVIGCKDSNQSDGQTVLEEVSSEESTEVADKAAKTILFFGDSITAGYGLDDTDDAFPGVIQEKIDSLELDYTVVNSGVSGETSAGGLARINWVLNQAMDVFVLELGANDGLRGVPISETKANLQGIIDAVKKTYPETTIVLAGMQLPPNMGQDYTTEFQALFPELAEKNDLKLIPFILEDVGGVKGLNQSDGIHPTIEGHQVVAQNVWRVLEPVLD